MPASAHAPVHQFWKEAQKDRRRFEAKFNNFWEELRLVIRSCTGSSSSMNIDNPVCCVCHSG